MGRGKKRTNKVGFQTALFGEKPPCDPNGISVIDVKQTQVPPGVLPDGLNGLVYHASAAVVNNSGYVPKKRWGSDDNAYRLYPDLHRMIPRAYSILVVKGPNRELVGRSVIQGFYKFSSRSSVDEDSSVAVAHLLDPKLLAGADRCVLTEKANGKSAVVTMVTIKGQRYLFGGSKGAHRLVPLKEGARKFIEKDCTIGGVAEQILVAFLDQWEAMSPANQDILAKRLLGPSGSVVVPADWEPSATADKAAAPDPEAADPDAAGADDSAAAAAGEAEAAGDAAGADSAAGDRKSVV